MLFRMKTWLLLQISTICHTGSTSVWASPSCLALTAASYCPILSVIAFPRFKHSHMFSNFRKLAPIRRPSVVTSLPPVVTNQTDSLMWDHELHYFYSAPWEEGRLLLEPLCESVSEISEFLRSTNVASRSEMPNWVKGAKIWIIAKVTSPQIRWAFEPAVGGSSRPLELDSGSES